MKKRVVGLFWALGGCLSLWASDAAPVELKGIVQFPKSEGLATSPGGQAGSHGTLAALMESRPTTPQHAEEISFLEEGQRKGDLDRHCDWYGSGNRKRRTPRIIVFSPKHREKKPATPSRQGRRAGFPGQDLAGGCELAQRARDLSAAGRPHAANVERDYAAGQDHFGQGRAGHERGIGEGH